MQKDVKITVCPPAYAEGYDGGASIICGYEKPKSATQDWQLTETNSGAVAMMRRKKKGGGYNGEK